jgi:hypothetical protein
MGSARTALPRLAWTALVANVDAHVAGRGLEDVLGHLSPEVLLVDDAVGLEIDVACTARLPQPSGLSRQERSANRM